MKKNLNIVWLKRDLRTFDHEPLHEASNDKELTQFERFYVGGDGLKLL